MNGGHGQGKTGQRSGPGTGIDEGNREVKAMRHKYWEGVVRSKVNLCKFLEADVGSWGHEHEDCKLGWHDVERGPHLAKPPSGPDRSISSLDTKTTAIC